jgi:alpha-galactosidase/6-phospho-beta-glucosidase family protein
VGGLPRAHGEADHIETLVTKLTTELTPSVEYGASISDRREHIYHAVILDPLISALLILDQRGVMVDEMIDAEAQWLPAFATASPAHLVLTAGGIAQ